VTCDSPGVRFPLEALSAAVGARAETWTRVSCAGAFARLRRRPEPSTSSAHVRAALFGKVPSQSRLPVGAFDLEVSRSPFATGLTECESV
jgi:hypothetical protein